MTKTSLEVCTYALRRIGVTAVGLASSSEDHASAKETLEAYVSELSTTDGAAFTWDIETIPDHLYFPIAGVVACRVAPMVSGQMVESEARASMRVRAALFPNDTADRRDADNDGTISDAEAQSGLEATYY